MNNRTKKKHPDLDLFLIKKYRQKIDKYEILLRDLDNSSSEDDELSQSGLFETTLDGEIQKKVKTNLDSSFVVVNQVPKIEDLSKSTYQVIKKQDSYSTYTKVEDGIKKAGGVYTWTNYLLGIGSLIIWFL